MLELKQVSKVYRVGGIQTVALDGVSVSFRKKEFVAILGMSGSGKTTCLNIIGGLDHCDSGEVIIKGRSTKSFSEGDWDAYRNNSIGFVFQNYNLIMHQSIVANVELGMTLSGVPAAEKRRRALDVLVQAGLRDHLHKKPGQLSGGQMQRVAIARALANDPEVLLCDEPTGALDSATSAQIMDLIRKVAGERLVIMVTHNAAIAEKYADRLIRFSDGRIVSDSNPPAEQAQSDSFGLKKTSMGFLTALKLSFNNIRTKKGRAFLTAFASSIGIIGIAVILSLSSGFQRQIDIFQRDAMTEFPIVIARAAMTVDSEQMAAMRGRMIETAAGTQEYLDVDEVYPFDPDENRVVHTNLFTEDFLDHLKDIDPEICSAVSYLRSVTMNVLRLVDGKAVPVSFGSSLPSSRSGSTMQEAFSVNALGLSSFPASLKKDGPGYLEENYQLLAGAYPTDPTSLVLVVDERNRVNADELNKLGFAAQIGQGLSFSDIVGTEFRIVSNDDYYVKTLLGTYMPGQDYAAMYASDKSISARITGIVRLRQGVRIGLLGTGVAYSDALTDLVLRSAAESEVVKAQKKSGGNVLSLLPLSESARSSLLSLLGANTTPVAIMVYPDNFEDKDAVKAYLDSYNAGREEAAQIHYSDMSETLSQMTGGIMTGITVVLIAFSSIALVVSLIMIAIITYTSVLERTKEIGVLRSLGARRKDITRVFDAETFILGLLSGALGVTIAALLTIPANMILFSLTGLSGVASLLPGHAVLLVALSTALTILGGHVPARMAAKKDAVEALRSE